MLILNLAIAFIILFAAGFLLIFAREQLSKFRRDFDKHQLDSLSKLQESLHNSIEFMSKQVTENLNQNNKNSSEHIDKLRKTVHEQLQQISSQVEKRLSEGFEKTTATFTDVVKRLALIDEAQKKIADLSCNVVSLQEILIDKRSRGAFGEVQLENIIKNVIPEKHLSMQHTLSNGKRVDCFLFLPEPSGNIAIDAKFPLENFQQMTNTSLSEANRKLAEQRFRVDIKKHIVDISSKYIIEGQTADGAVMFIPAEAIFAEIHANYPDLVELAQRSRVWMVSPTTLVAILTTANAVIKDTARKKQIHIIQEHLHHLSKDFDRFRKRMDNLTKHISQAHEDAQSVNTSADKIVSRFGKIEKAEVGSLENT